MTTTKIVVTHGGKLRKKYKTAGWTKINAALKKLIAADAARGIATTVVELDTLTPAKAVTNKPKTFKAAIDQAFLAYNRPDYVLILGGPDVVPHQPLRNPLFVPKGKDWDKTVPSDLPYACDAPYSTVIEDFLGPSRVVGRLPDLPRATKPQLLVALIDLAAKATESPAAGKAYFGLSCVEWKGSTTKSLVKIFGAGSKPRLSPIEGPVWTKAALGPGWHFINCHGAPKDPQFYGQEGEDYPVSHHSPELSLKVSAGTVVAAECCYGAEIYNPRKKAGGIGITYLREGAMGFLGSTNIAYGPEDDNDSADLVCRYFLESARSGASLGRSLLEARQKYIAGAVPVDPTALKTVGQFLLMGDPSLHAVAGAKPKTRPTAKMQARSAATTASAHAVTRGALTETAALLSRGADSVKTGVRTTSNDAVRSKFASVAAKAGMVTSGPVSVFQVCRGIRSVGSRGGGSKGAQRDADRRQVHTTWKRPVPRVLRHDDRQPTQRRGQGPGQGEGQSPSRRQTALRRRQPASSATRC